MSYTRGTDNYNLPQYIGTDKPTYLGDQNSAYATIDRVMKQNSDKGDAAVETANAANATAITANETATLASNEASLAKSVADAATNLSQEAIEDATIAKTTAESAARAAESNSISNLAPSYDPLRTYAVGDIVSYIDENNTGKLYKCILPWNTPGNFNINYWDDVTATEIFLTGYELIGSWTPSTSDTWASFGQGTLFPALRAAIPLASEMYSNISNSDVVLVLINKASTNRLEIFRMNNFSDHIKDGAPAGIFIFERAGSGFPEVTGDSKQNIAILSCSESPASNVNEVITFKHERINDPGNNTPVIVTPTIDLTSRTFVAFNGQTDVRIYQRK